MTFADLATFLLLSAGIQYAVGAAVLTAPLRQRLPAFFRTLVECTACCGFWIGTGLAACGQAPAVLDGAAVPGILNAVAAGLVATVGVPLIRYFGPDGGT